MRKAEIRPSAAFLVGRKKSAPTCPLLELHELPAFNPLVARKVVGLPGRGQHPDKVAVPAGGDVEVQ